MARTDVTPRSRIDDAFARARSEDRALVMPYLVAGYPDADTFVAVARAAADAGADLFEIGIPFSDPIMDGPVIAAASNQVLERGQTVAQGLELLSRACEATGVPALAMTYYNIAFRFGLGRFATTLAERGACGAILPDLSVEDAGEWRAACDAAGIAPVFIASQTSPPERLRALASAGGGFVYAASLLGVTGVRETLNERVRGLVGDIRAVTDLPVAVGIGVSTAEHAREVAAFADGVIVGSAVVRLAGGPDPARAVAGFVSGLRASVTREPTT